MTTRSGIAGPADRSILAGASGRQVSEAGEKHEEHAGKRAGALDELLKTMASAPDELAPDGMSRVLAILVAEIVNALEPTDRSETLAVIANRLDGCSRRGRGAAAAMLGAIGAGLMRME